MEKSDTNSKLTSEKRKELNLIIVNNIKRLLNQKNQTYTNLAEYLNMARASVSAWLTGVRGVSPTKYQDIARFLDVSLEELMTYTPTNALFLKFPYFQWHELNDLNSLSSNDKKIEFFNNYENKLNKPFCVQLNSDVMQGEEKYIHKDSYLIIDQRPLEHIENYTHKVVIVKNKNNTIIGEFNYNFGEPILIFWNKKYQQKKLSSDFTILGIVVSTTTFFNDNLIAKM